MGCITYIRLHQCLTRAHRGRYKSHRGQIWKPSETPQNRDRIVKQPKRPGHYKRQKDTPKGSRQDKKTIHERIKEDNTHKLPGENGGYKGTFIQSLHESTHHRPQERTGETRKEIYIHPEMTGREKKQTLITRGKKKDIHIPI